MSWSRLPHSLIFLQEDYYRTTDEIVWFFIINLFNGIVLSLGLERLDGMYLFVKISLLS